MRAMGGYGAFAAVVVAAGCHAGGGVLVGTGGTTGTGVIMAGSGGAHTTIVGSGGAVVSSTGAGGFTNGCDGRVHPAITVPPNIMIVLDTSASMNDPIDGACTTASQSKWAASVDAINSVVDGTTLDVNWSLAFMGDTSDACGVGPGAILSEAVRPALAYRTNGGAPAVTGNRPMRAAVTSAMSWVSVDEPPERVILLITDGAPNCMAGAADARADDTVATVTSVKYALANGVYTFVVGLATAGGPADAALEQIALSGGFSRAGSPVYFPASSSGDLVTAMKVLVSATTECFFVLPLPATNDGTVSRENISVVTDDATIPQDQTNGWTYTDNTHSAIQLHGASCEAVRNGHPVSVIFRCLIG
jgi:hypothetical protein